MPAMTRRSCRPAVDLVDEGGADGRHEGGALGAELGRQRGQHGGCLGERLAADTGVELRAELADEGLVDRDRRLDAALLDVAGVGDEHRHQAGLAETNELDVTNRGSGERGVLDERDLVGELRQQPHRAREHLVEIGRVAEERLDGRALGAGQRPQVGKLVDEQAVPLVGGHSTRRRVGRGDQLFFFEQRHVVADRGRGDTELVALDDRLRTDGLARLDVVVDDDAENLETSLADHGRLPPRIRNVARLALAP